MSALRLVRVEMSRALHRQAVRVLILIALVGVGAIGVIAFVDSTGRSVAELSVNGTHPAIMADWWLAGTGDGILMIGAVPLLVGGLLGGATVAGAEWKAGTITTLLTWEPRRLRLHAARATSAFVLATVIGVGLQGLFLAATLPAVFAHGSTAGVDTAWAVALAAAIARIALLTGGVAVLGVSLATLGRNTTVALVGVIGWLLVGESLIRALKPSLYRLLVAENLATVLVWTPVGGAGRSATVAALTLTAYACIIAALAAAAFHARDVAGAN